MFRRAILAAGLLALVATAASAQDKTAKAIFAGGCFWGVQGVFQHVKGVKNAVSGYAGGEQSTAVYEMVGTGATGHAEAVEVTYDPHQVSYGKLLQVFFSVAHNPTQLNYQGPDHGPQYRTALFPLDAEQEKVAASYIGQLEGAKLFDGKIVTTLEGAKAFYPAEAYHQDYHNAYPMQYEFYRRSCGREARLRQIWGDS